MSSDLDLAKILVEDQLRHEKEALAALCLRLGIDQSQSVDVWALIGRALAAEQPEFTGKRRGRGRPRGRGFNIDLERALAIEELSGLLEGAYPARRLIEKLHERKSKLFASGSLASLERSVSKGTTQIAALRKELRESRELRRKNRE